jgi:hypothetical protein
MPQLVVVFGTMNLFRNILPGELAFDAGNYSTISFRTKFIARRGSSGNR